MCSFCSSSKNSLNHHVFHNHRSHWRNRNRRNHNRRRRNQRLAEKQIWLCHRKDSLYNQQGRYESVLEPEQHSSEESEPRDLLMALLVVPAEPEQSALHPESVLVWERALVPVKAMEPQIREQVRPAQVRLVPVSSEPRSTVLEPLPQSVPTELELF